MTRLITISLGCWLMILGAQWVAFGGNPLALSMQRVLGFSLTLAEVMR